MKEKRQKPWGRFLLFAAAFWSAAVFSGCRIHLLPFDDKIVEVADDDKEEAPKAKPAPAPQPEDDPNADLPF